MPKVPVLGIPVLNKPDMLQRMLTTIDFDVERLYIVDNGGVVKPEHVAHFRAGNVHVADVGFNLGVGPAWNFIIRANINAPWWLIGCNDMNVEAGAVGRLYEDMEAHTGQPHMARVIMGNEASWGNHFGLFALNPEAIELIGWFDENIYPIYYEDNDYIERIERAKVVGFTISDIASDTHHIGTQSWKDVPHNAVGNKRTWDLNRDYYDAKWAKLQEVPHELPWGAGNSPLDQLRYWPQLSVQRLRQQDWNVQRRDNVKNEGIIS